MRKSLCLALSCALAAALGWAPRAPAATSLTLTNLFPPSHVHSKLLDAFAEEIKSRTGGEVTIQHFPGQTLTKGDQTYDGVVNGIADIGTSLFAYTRGRFPVMEAVDLPLGYPNGKTATAVINEVYREMQPKELDDVHVLYVHAHGPGLIHSRTKPIRTMADMKGLKFRATGFSAKMVQALGGTPVAMPMPETYQSLQKGVVDGATYPMEADKGWKLGEVTKYATENYSMAYTSGFFVVMNKAKWNALPANVQKVFDEVSAAWVKKTGEAWDEIDAEGKEFFLKQGNEMVPLSAEESARWKAAVAPIRDEYVAAATAKGVDGKKALAVTLEALEKYSKQYAQ